MDALRDFALPVTRTAKHLGSGLQQARVSGGMRLMASPALRAAFLEVAVVVDVSDEIRVLGHDQVAREAHPRVPATLQSEAPLVTVPAVGDIGGMNPLVREAGRSRPSPFVAEYLPFFALHPQPVESRFQGHGDLEPTVLKRSGCTILGPLRSLDPPTHTGFRLGHSQHPEGVIADDRLVSWNQNFEG
jgi:hypothetical protein